MVPSAPCSASSIAQVSSCSSTPIRSSPCPFPGQAALKRCFCRTLGHSPSRQLRRSRAPALVHNGIGHGIQPDLSTVQFHPRVGVDSTASMSRIFIGVQPAKIAFRNLSRTRPSGPISVLIVILTLISALFAAIRARIVHNVRACSACHGYGISRCSLCGGSGRVGWEGKWSHKEPCPMCMGRRYVECAECGGHYHRPMFRHVHRAAVDNDEDFDSSMQPPRVLVIMED